MKVYNCIINLEDDGTSLDLISIVDDPANKSMFIALKNEETKKIYLQDEEKKIITGAVLIPNQQILRSDESGEKYFIKYDKENIEKALLKYAMNSNNTKVNKNHNEKLDGSKIFVYENWIIEDEEKDKSVKLGFNYPVGTWMATYKVLDDKLWGDIKSGKLKGFSIEGNFIFEEETVPTKQRTLLSSMANGEKVINNNMKSIFNKIQKLLTFVKMEAEGYTLEDGTQIIIDENYAITYAADNTVPADGEYTLEDGRTIMVEAGFVIGVNEPETEDAATPETETEETANGIVNETEVPAENEVGTKLEIFEVIDGEPLFWDMETNIAYKVIDGERTEELYPAGDYITMDNKILMIDESGNIVVIEVAEAMKQIKSKLADLETKLKEEKKEKNKLLKDFSDYKKGFGGTELSLSSLKETEEIAKPTMSKSQERMAKWR